MAAIGDLFQTILFGIAEVTGSYGLAIIVFTLAVKLLLAPLTVKQNKNMAVMRELQPAMKELQEKYKDNPQEYQKRLIALYREKNFNPLGGCLPQLVQLPFLFAIFFALREFPADATISPEFFIWDLSKPDPTLVFPVLAAVSTYYQSKLMITDPNQKVMLYVMPGLLGLFSVSFPAGLVLYWVVSNLFGAGQHYLMNRAGASREGGTSA